MGVANDYPKSRAIRVDEEQTRHCRRCPIKAQVAARVGLTGFSLEYTKKRALDDPSRLQGKGASASAPALRMLSGLIYLDFR